MGTEPEFITGLQAAAASIPLSLCTLQERIGVTYQIWIFRGQHLRRWLKTGALQGPLGEETPLYWELGYKGPQQRPGQMCSEVTVVMMCHSHGSAAMRMKFS